MERSLHRDIEEYDKTMILLLFFLCSEISMIIGYILGFYGGIERGKAEQKLKGYMT